MWGQKKFSSLGSLQTNVVWLTSWQVATTVPDFENHERLQVDQADNYSTCLVYRYEYNWWVLLTSCTRGLFINIKTSFSCFAPDGSWFGCLSRKRCVWGKTISVLVWCFTWQSWTLNKAYSWCIECWFSAVVWTLFKPRFYVFCVELWCVFVC